MTTLLVLSQEKNVCIALLNADGVFLSTVPISTDTDETVTPDDAVRLAENVGWQTYGEWIQDGDERWIIAVPKPITITFAGSEITDEQALYNAKAAGYEVREVVRQTPDPVAGKTYIAFSVDKPHLWDWGTYEPF